MGVLDRDIQSSFDSCVDFRRRRIIRRIHAKVFSRVCHQDIFVSCRNQDLSSVLVESDNRVLLGVVNVVGLVVRLWNQEELQILQNFGHILRYFDHECDLLEVGGSDVLCLEPIVVVASRILASLSCKPISAVAAEVRRGSAV